MHLKPFSRRSFSQLSALALGVVLASGSLAQEKIMLSTQQVKNGYIENAAMAQYHRWFQLYENNAVPMANQLDLLAQDVRVKSGLGEAVGHAAYEKRLADIPKTWKNAHRVLDSQITLGDGGRIDLVVSIEYLNQGANPDGSLRAARLKYTTQLQSSDTVLPKFTALTIEPIAATDTKQFVDTYPENRLKSLAYYWLALVEDPARRFDPFKEILAADFKLDFSSGVIPDMEGFEKWFRGPASAVAASTHRIRAFNFSQVASGAYEVKMDLDWQGILPNGIELAAKTRHTWLVQDDVKERFARIKNVQVQVLQPFAPLVR